MELQAQSGLKLTDYYFNPIQYNPAYVGASNDFFVKGTYTSQWLGFDDGPLTQTFDAQKRFSNNKYAAGISLLNDDFGSVKNFNFETNLALHLMTSDAVGIVLGLKAGVNNFSIDYNRLNIFNPSEDVYNQGNLSELKPVIGAGFYFYGEKWFFGMSTPNFLSHRTENGVETSIYNKIAHYYSTAGFDVTINPNMLLKSQVLMQLVKGAPFSTLLSTRLQYKNQLGFGVHYQPDALYGAFVNLSFKSNLTLTYGYDMALSDFNQYTNGNHFFGLSYKLSKQDKMDEANKDRVYMIR